MSTDNAASGAPVHTTLAAIFFSMELSRSTWLVTSLSPDGSEKMSRHSLPAGDIAGLMELLERIREKTRVRTGTRYSFVSIQEAGLDGFWIHRALVREGIDSHVVDPASVATSRRRRRAKTDRLDGETLLRTLLAYKRGDPRICAMVRPPSPEEEDRRRNSRERHSLIVERGRLVNRIKGLLFCHGVREFYPLHRNRRERFEALSADHGLPSRLRAEIGRMIERIELILDHLKNNEGERDAMIASVREDESPARAANLMMLKGIGPDSAETLWSEGLYRQFDNRRQLAAYAGLAPTPWQSGTISREQGVSQSGNPRLRSIMVQVSWLWLLHQPQSALTKWFRERTKIDGRRKSTIIALARKLLIALWKFVHHGVIIEGADMKHA